MGSVVGKAGSRRQARACAFELTIAVASKNGLVGVLPQGFVKTGVGRSWNQFVGQPMQTTASDVEDLVAEVALQHP